MPISLVGSLELAGVHLSGPTGRLPVSPAFVPAVAEETSRPSSRSGALPTFQLDSRRGSIRQRLFCQVRAPELLLPALDPINDLTRIRNMGKPLQSRNGFLSQSASMPNLQSFDVGPSSPSSCSQSPKKMMASLRLTSQVVQYPDFNPLSPEGRATQKQSPRYQAPSPRLRMREKQVTFEDLPPPELEEIAKITSSVSEELGGPSLMLKRSMHKLEGLHALRRIRCKTKDISLTRSDTSTETLECEASAPEPSLADAVKETTTEDDPLLPSTLKNLEDTSEELFIKSAEIAEAQKLVKLCGGLRHPTSIIAERVAAVMLRKAKLLKDVEDRQAEFEAAQSRCQEILEGIVEGSVETPKALQNIRKFIATYVHRPGNPVDADRSNFGAFVSSFKLPSKHIILEQFRELSTNAGRWWVDSTVQAAADGASYTAIKTLIELSVSVGADPDDPSLKRANQLLLDRIAEFVLRVAKDFQARDTLAEKKASDRSEIMAVGLASKSADNIDEEIKKAVQSGVKEQDPRIQESYAICKALREADGQRKRLHARQKRLAENAKKG